MTTTDRPQQTAALNARDDLRWIVRKWPELQARLTPGGGNAQNGVVSSSGDAQLPIDVHVSDLMFEIEEQARFYGKVLLDEIPARHGCHGACHGSSGHLCAGRICATDGSQPIVTDAHCPLPEMAVSTSHMPRLLLDVAERYGHFTEDEREALEFMDFASDYRMRVAKTLERPEPAMYIGPCRHRGEDGSGCTGELYVSVGKTAGKCRECGTPFTLAEQREFLDSALEDRLMTASEIGRALKILGTPVAPATIRKWVQRGRLIEAVEDTGLYRLADAKALSEIGRRSGAVAA